MLEVTNKRQLAMSDNILIQGIPELDHFYAFNVKDGDHFKLNRTAYWVLETIGSGRRFEDLITRYMVEFEVDINTARKDLHEVISFALKNKIIMEVSDEKA
jgi:hypothetical protein